MSFDRQTHLPLLSSLPWLSHHILESADLDVLSDREPTLNVGNPNSEVHHAAMI